MKKQHHTEQDRLYFITRSLIMSQVGAIIFLSFIIILKTINVIQSIFIGITLFVASLTISRFFSNHIDKVVGFVLIYLNRHKKLKKFILKHF